MEYEIKPISANEWLPDRCLTSSNPLDPTLLKPEGGCSSFVEHCERFNTGNRKILEKLYYDTLSRFGCCGFVAWFQGEIIGYNNFFPSEIANDLKFYGWGTEKNVAAKTLVHNCISIIQNNSFRRKGIGSNLIIHSLRWGKANDWKRMEVHLVLPKHVKNFSNEQKSGQEFWEKLGFNVFISEEACAETKKMYGVNERLSMFVDLEKWKM